MIPENLPKPNLEYHLLYFNESDEEIKRQRKLQLENRQFYLTTVAWIKKGKKWATICFCVKLIGKKVRWFN